MASTTAVAQTGPLAGVWKGVWTKGGDALPVTMTFAKTDEGYTGAFDSDALQVVGIPLSAISDTDGRVHFEIKGDQSTSAFDGTISGASLSGSVADGGAKDGFVFQRSAAPPAPVAAREVTFTDGDVTLAGTLLSPAGAGKHPAILFLQGSGPEGRWANHYLAQAFAEAGFVALIYDKRGVGQSTGDWRKVGFEALSDDAAAGVRLLRALPEVDPAKVGIYGHSQGGTIAPLVAVRAGGLGFVIASAAGGIDPAEVETYSVSNQIGVAGLPAAEQPDALAYVHALIDVAYRGGDRSGLERLAARFKTRDWYFDPPAADDSYWTVSRQIAAYRPADYWRQVKAPVLLVYGRLDERVPPQASIDAIRAALGGRVTVKLYPDADHTFTVIDPAHKGGWPKHEADYAATLTDWARAQ